MINFKNQHLFSLFKCPTKCNNSKKFSPQSSKDLLQPMERSKANPPEPHPLLRFEPRDPQRFVWRPVLSRSVCKCHWSQSNGCVCWISHIPCPPIVLAQTAWNPHQVRETIVQAQANLPHVPPPLPTPHPPTFTLIWSQGLCHSCRIKVLQSSCFTESNTCIC